MLDIACKVRPFVSRTALRRTLPRPRGGLAIGLGLAVMCAHEAPARAQDSQPVTLSWDVPASCPGLRTVSARIGAQLPSGFETDQTWSAEGRIFADRGRFRLELTLRNADFEAHKTLRNASCEALTDAAALLLAMALNPSAVPAASTSANADGDEDGDAATPRSRVERRSGGTPPGRDRQRSHPSGSEREPRGHGSRSAHATPRQPDAESRFAWPDVAFGLGADAGLQTGMLPQTPAPGLRAQLVLGVGRLRTAAAVALWPSTRTAAEGHWRGQLDAHGWVAAFEISWRLVPARLQLGPTVLLERGELSVASIGVSAPASAATIWTAAGFGLYGAYALADGFALTAEALAITPFARPRWVLRTPRGDVAAFTADAVGLRLYTGVAYVFE